MINLKKFSQQWLLMSAEGKRRWVVGGSFVVVILGSLIVTLMTQHKKTGGPIDTEQETKVMVPNKGATDLQSLAAAMMSIGQRVDGLDAAMKAKASADTEKQTQIDKKIDESNKATVDELRKQLQDWQERMKNAKPNDGDGSGNGRKLPKVDLAPSGTGPALNAQLPNSNGVPAGYPGVGGNAGFNPNSPNVAPAAMTTQSTVEAPTKPSRRLILASEEESKADDPKPAGPSSGNSGGSKTDSPAGAGKGAGVNAGSAAKADAKKDRVYIPAGALFGGITLSGMDAPTSKAAAQNPMPLLIRVKTSTILPNRVRANLKECFVLASGFGELSSERVKLRTEKISCVRHDGGVIEAKLDGTVMGEDGKVGMRGRVVTKQGAMIANSLLAGFLGGLGTALKPTTVPSISIGGTNTTTQPSMSDVLNSGVYSGAGNAMNNVANFYLDMAKEEFPVVELDAARHAEIMLINGVSLQFTK